VVIVECLRGIGTQDSKESRRKEMSERRKKTLMDGEVDRVGKTSFVEKCYALSCERR